MFINILLPYKEKFSINKASSVSLTVANNLEFSKYKKQTRIFGHDVKDPMYENNFIGIQNSSKKSSVNFRCDRSRWIVLGRIVVEKKLYSSWSNKKILKHQHFES